MYNIFETITVKFLAILCRPGERLSAWLWTREAHKATVRRQKANTPWEN